MKAHADPRSGSALHRMWIVDPHHCFLKRQLEERMQFCVYKTSILLIVGSIKCRFTEIDTHAGKNTQKIEKIREPISA